MTVYINGTTGYTGPISSVGSISSSGNLTFTGVGAIISGDFSNATLLSRTMFQTTTANSSTGIYALPSGSSTAASWQATNAADPTNASKILIATNGSTDVQLVSGRNGSGTYLPLTFYTNGSEQMRLDTSGNLGLGVTPSAWASGTKAIQIGSRTSVYDYASANTYLGNNIYNSATGDKYIASAAASVYQLSGGSHVWSIAPSGTAGNAITWTQAMTLNASGELLLGTTSNIGVGAKAAFYSSGNVLHIQSTNASANNFVSYNSSGSAAFTVANNGSAYSNGAVQATSSSSTTGLIVAQSTGASATQYGRFTANSADIAIGQNIATSPGNWSKIDNAVASSGWVFNGRTAVLWTSAAGTSTPLEFLPYWADQYGNVHIDGGSTTFQLNSTDHAHTLGSITTAPSTLSRLNIQERAGNWISWVNGGGGFYGAVYLSGSTVVYGGASDYRLKENIRPIKDATARLMQLKPVTFDWIESKQTAEGFIAHELQEVVPDAVAGEKDGVNELGEPKWQAVDKSFVVPLLTQALQELRAEFDAYKLTHP